jgi:hypothetical protein
MFEDVGNPKYFLTGTVEDLDFSSCLDHGTPWQLTPKRNRDDFKRAGNMTDRELHLKAKGYA